MRVVLRRCMSAAITGRTRKAAIDDDLVCRLQLTLAILKPDVVAHPHKVQEIKDVILQNNFYFIRSKMVKWSRSDAEQFYTAHKGRFFYNRLVGFMSMGPISVHVLARQGAITHWRNLMGPTKTFRARHEAPNSLRAKFGLTDTRNATHGSDSEDNARQEIGQFFSQFDIDSWYKTEEPIFRKGKVKFCTESCIHVIDSNDR